MDVDVSLLLRVVDRLTNISRVCLRIEGRYDRDKSRKHSHRMGLGLTESVRAIELSSETLNEFRESGVVLVGR